jgi:hypothetical protein
MKSRKLLVVFVVLFAVSVIYGCTNSGSVEKVRVAYVYDSNADLAAVFESLLESSSYEADLVTLDQIETTDFSVYAVILIGHDSDLDHSTPWGTSSQRNRIVEAAKPIVAIGRGGTLFLDDAYDSEIGWGDCWIGDYSSVVMVDSASSVWNTPNDIDTSTGTVQAYVSDCSSSNAAYIDPIPANIVCVGRQVGDLTHYLIAKEDASKCLWGFSGLDISGVVDMTAEGEALFLNLVYEMAN